MKPLSVRLAWTAVGIALAAGCAVGEEGGAVIPGGTGAKPGADSGSSDTGSSGHSLGGEAGAAGSLDDGGEGGLAGASGLGGAAGSSGEDGGAGTAGYGGYGGYGGGAGYAGSAGTGGSAGSGGTGTPCTATNTCMGAQSLGSINADSGGSLDGSGYTSQWVQVRAKEDNSSPMGEPMKLSITLTVPQGLNFDLYVYMNKDSDTVECSKLMDFSLNQGSAQESIQFSWGESGTFANNSDDSRTVSIEIRHMEGTCSPSSKWTLSVKGG